MQQHILLLFLALLSVDMLRAQSPMNAAPEIFTGQNENRMQQEMFIRSAQVSNPALARQIADKRESDVRRAIFYRKANKFVDLWTNFAKELNERQTFNTKLAKEVSKAFRDLEKSEGWPVNKPK